LARRKRSRNIRLRSPCSRGRGPWRPAL